MWQGARYPDRSPWYWCVEAKMPLNIDDAQNSPQERMSQPSVSVKAERPQQGPLCMAGGSEWVCACPVLPLAQALGMDNSDLGKDSRPGAGIPLQPGVARASVRGKRKAEGVRTWGHSSPSNSVCDFQL